MTTSSNDSRPTIIIVNINSNDIYK